MPPYMYLSQRYRTQARRRYAVRSANRRGQPAQRRSMNRSIGRMAYGGRNRIAIMNQRTGGLLGIEHKYFDCAKGLTIIASPTDSSGGEINPSTGCTGCLSAPAQGDGPQNREGNKIVIDSCLVQGTIRVDVQANQTGADAVPIVYVALVLDTQTNGVEINSEDVFSNPLGSTRTAAQPFRNMSYTSRFRVLKTWKRQITMPSLTYDGTNIEQSGFNVPFTLSWKGKIPVTFTVASTTADVANVTNNSLQMIAFTNDSSLNPQIAYNSRIRFYG